MRQIMVKIAVFVLVVVFHQVAWSSSAQMQDIHVEVEGMGISKDDALLRAKRNAVLQGIGHLVISETEVKNFNLEKDHIITRTMGAVKRYKILEIKEHPDHSFDVRIEAVVSLANLNKDLMAMQILLESMNKPRVMVLIEENVGGKRSMFCETALVGKLLEYKFNIVDPAASGALRHKKDSLITRAVNGDLAAAIKLGVDRGAEVLLIGRVTSSMAEPMYNMKSAQADISIRAISCSNGAIISSVNVHDAAIQISDEAAQAEAVKKAALKMVSSSEDGESVASFFDILVGSWQDSVNNGLVIRVLLDRIQSFKQYSAVKNVLSSYGNDVVSITQRGWKKPLLEYDIVFKGSSEALAELLDGAAVPGFGKLSVESLEAATLALSLNP